MVTTDTQALSVKMALSNWDIQIMRTNKTLAGITDEQLMAEIAPGRNRGIYILGHMAAVHDAMLPVLGLGEKLRPGFDAIFITNPDKAVEGMPTAAEVRKYWNDVNTELNNHFSKLQPDEWFMRHNSVSAEDFAKEPHRNKLNLLMNRTSHVGYHLGQLILLTKKAAS